MNYILSHFERDAESTASHHDILCFLNSKVKNVPDAKLVFFTNLKEDAPRENVEFIDATNLSRMSVPATDRFQFYLDYLNSSSFSETDRFIFCDCRDVCFARNPFKVLDFYRKDLIIIGAENSAYTINSDGCNLNWINIQNPRNAGLFGDKSIICSGVVLATGWSIAKLFLSQMCCIALYYNNILKREGTNDQGLLNELYHLHLEKYPENVAAIPNENNPLMFHLALCDSSSYKLDTENIIVTSSGVKPCILHQYDRHPPITHEVRTRFLRV